MTTNMRKMINSFEGKVFYESTFDQNQGVLVRVVETREKFGRYGIDDLVDWLFRDRNYREVNALREKWNEKFSWSREEAFSPSPETIDVQITNWCNVGCEYCYQDSTTSQSHAPDDHIVSIIKQFDHAPYQVAIGGGEPTAHPALPKMLVEARELGSVPNYTTAGHIWREDVIEATNAVCGGISLTFHAFKGIEWFTETYMKWRKAVHRPINIHLIADKDVVKNLQLLLEMQKKVGPLSVILLAFYPNIGRAGLIGIMPKTVYHHELPVMLSRALETGMKISFSEGLLPFFISRPEIGVNTKFATRSEGLFSAYVDMNGNLSESSFNPSRVWTDENGNPVVQIGARKRLQTQWNHLHFWSREGDSCSPCVHRKQCSMPNIHHYFACAYAEHNNGNPPLTKAAQQAREKNQRTRAYLDAYHEKTEELGRGLNDEEVKELLTKYPDPFGFEEDED